MIHFRFVDDHRTEYSVKRKCTVLRLNRASYYKWRDGTCRCQVRICDDIFLGVRIMVTSPKEVYVGDITYLPIKGGKNMYLVTVIDCYSRRLTGFCDCRSHAHRLSH